MESTRKNTGQQTKGLKFLVIQGPNLNLIGTREPDRYGHENIELLHLSLEKLAGIHSVDLTFFQSNSEGAIVDAVQQARMDEVDGILINAGAYTHTSIAIRDAMLAVQIPFVEIHISNIYAREDFRTHSYLSDIALGQVTGFGTDSYRIGFLGLVCKLTDPGTPNHPFPH